MQLIPMSLVRWTLYLFVDMSSSATKHRRYDFFCFETLQSASYHSPLDYQYCDIKICILPNRIRKAVLYHWLQYCNPTTKRGTSVTKILSLCSSLFLSLSISSSCIYLCPSLYLLFFFSFLSLLLRWRSTQKVDLTRSLASPRHQKHLKRLSIWLEGKALWLLLVCLQVWYYEKRQGYLAAVTVL